MTAILERSDLEAINAARRVGVGVGVYAWSPGRGGVHHHRIAEPLRVLGEHGWNVGHGTVLSNEILSSVDTVLVHTIHGERESEAWEDLARLGTHRLVYDVDDWMWDPDYRPFRDHYTRPVLDRLFRNVSLAHVVTTPAPAIADYLARHNPNVHVVPNTVPGRLFDPYGPVTYTSIRRRHLDAPAIGWQISDSHIGDVTPDVTSGVARFLARHQNWRVHTYGALSFTPGPWMDPAMVSHTAWTVDLDAYYRSMDLTIGLGPARNTAFNRGKSALRAIEYAALGVVAVLPDLPIYRGWVDNGTTGRLIPRSSQPARTLAGILNELASDRSGLEAMAAAARRRAESWTTEANIGRWVQAWQTV